MGDERPVYAGNEEHINLPDTEGEDEARTRPDYASSVKGDWRRRNKVKMPLVPVLAVVALVREEMVERCLTTLEEAMRDLTETL